MVIHARGGGCGRSRAPGAFGVGISANPSPSPSPSDKLSSSDYTCNSDPGVNCAIFISSYLADRNYIIRVTYEVKKLSIESISLSTIFQVNSYLENIKFF